MKTAYPMLVYQASRPFRGKMRTELTYDILHPKTLAAFFRTVRPALGRSIGGRPRPTAGGRACTNWLRLYEPGRANAILESVQRLSKSRRCLYVLIRAEGVLVTHTDRLGRSGKPSRQDNRPAGWLRLKRSGDTNCAGCIRGRILRGWLPSYWRRLPSAANGATWMTRS